jgi:isocitrate dehydrogenase
MKMTDGLFHKVFDEIAVEYPDIENEAWIVDIGAAKMADTPEAFDVIVMPNLYGDILSDVAAQIAGSVGLAGSANIGDGCAMFEAIHGSAPRRAGQDLANPSGLLLGAVLMLVHIGQGDIAARVHNAWLRTMEDGVHTYDIFREEISKQKVGTKEFGNAVVARLGQLPQTLKAVEYANVAADTKKAVTSSLAAPKTELVGVDLYVDWPKADPTALAEIVTKANHDGLDLQMIDGRGVKLWPNGMAETFCPDNVRCRFMSKSKITDRDVIALLGRVADQKIEVVKTEYLRTFDGEAGFTLSQGQ